MKWIANNLQLAIVLTLFLVVILVLGSHKYKTRDGRLITIPENLSRISFYDSLSFDESWLDREYKIYIYSTHVGGHMHNEWGPMMEKYPDFAYIFIYGGADSLRMVKRMLEDGPKYPFLFDPKNEFHLKHSGSEKNWTSYAILTKNDRLLGPVNAFHEGYILKYLSKKR